MMISDTEIYVCTTCRSRLFLARETNQNGGSVNDGELVCRSCAARYPVIASPRPSDIIKNC